MGHRNARLNVRGRALLVERVVGLGRPVAHVAKELGVSRQCAHRWIGRFRREGEGGLQDRSARPQRSPNRTSAETEAHVLQVRRAQRRGPDWIGAELGIPPRTVGAILLRHHVPHLADCDPLTGELIRATRQTAQRYERSRPGELVDRDVKKLGRIPDGGGWRADGGTLANHAARIDRTPIGYDYVRSLIDDHSRFAYSEILPDEKGVTCAVVLQRAACYFAAHGIAQIERVTTDNALAKGQMLRAAALHRESLAIFARLGERRGVAAALEGLASVAVEPNPARATRLFAAAAALRELIHAPLDHAEHVDQVDVVVELRQRLGEEPFALAWAGGQQMSFEQAVAEASDAAQRRC